MGTSETSPADSTNGLAIAAIVSAVLAWTVCPLVGGVITIQPARGAQREIQLTGERGAQLAGLAAVAGWVNVAVWALPALALFAFAVVRLMRS